MNVHPSENRIVLSLASIFAFRMLGIFMLLPIFTLYADELQGANHILVGVAFGAYGLSQAMLQIPLGTLSDKFGRKRIITAGLIVFALGSVLCAHAHSIQWMIIGRTLQGMGAIGSTLIALVADLTPEQNRTKAMALVGMTIGTSFSIALILGPALSKHLGLSGVFYFIALLAVIGIIMLHTIIPNPKQQPTHSDSIAIPALFKSVIHNPELLRLDFGIFCQHAILTASFYVLPLILESKMAHSWYFYLPILVLAFICMIPFVYIAEKKRLIKTVFLFAIGLMATTLALLSVSYQHLNLLALLLFIFFIGFNILESTLPSLVSKIAPLGSKGTAMGVYSSAQFMGIFIGGIGSGFLYKLWSYQGVFLGSALLAILWLIVAAKMKKPKHLSSKIYPVNISSESHGLSIAHQIEAFEGVEDVFISQAEQVAYLKVDQKYFDETALEQLTQRNP